MGTDPYSVAAGDFNRDGKLDLAVANWSSNNVSVLLNTSPEIDVSGNGNSIADGDSTPSAADHTDFGGVDISAGTVNRTFTITNSGDAVLNLSGTPVVEITGHTADFAVTAQPDTTVASGGGTTTFDITFEPSVAGLREATVFIVSDDLDDTPYTFDVQGTGGSYSEIDVRYDGVAIADGDATPSTADGTDFGLDHFGYAAYSPEHTFTIHNLGSATLDLTNTPRVDVAGTDFSLTQDATASIAAGGSATFKIKFAASALTVRTGTVTIDNNDSGENPYNFSITGTGYSGALMIVQGGSPQQDIENGDTSPSTADYTDFGGSPVAGGTVDRIFEIENFGAGALSLTGDPIVDISGAHAAGFTVTDQPNVTIASGNNDTFTIRFDPSSAGLRTAIVSIDNDDPNRDPYTFAIQGTGAAPEMNLKQGATAIADGGIYDYGNQATGTNTYITFTIENTGLLALTLTTPVTISGADADQFSIQSQPVSLVTASGTTTFTVRFSPTSTGAKTATIPIASDDADENPYNLTLTGTGIQPPTTPTNSGEFYTYSNVDIMGSSQRLITDSTGRVMRTVETTAADGSLTITIPQGTMMKFADGQALHTLTGSVNEQPPLPPEGKHIIGLVYNFQPAGATFDPPITLTFIYDPANLPEGIAEEDLVIAFYNEATGEWVNLDCTIDTATHTITAYVSHFTHFAVIAPAPPSSPPVTPDPAAFLLSNLSMQPNEVEPGQTVTISVSVANTGGTAGSYTVVLDVNGAEEQTQSVSIPAGGSELVSFSVSRLKAGDYSVNAGGLEGVFAVKAPEPVSPPPAPPPAVTPPPPPAPAPLATNWWLIGGVIAGVILISAIAWRLKIFLRRG